MTGEQIKSLKVGDRVRIHGLENDGDIYSTTVGTYIECPELDGMSGTIIEVNKDGYIVREDSGYEEDFIGACLTLLERPRQTFEEIGKELNTKLGVEWGKVRFFDNRMEFRSVNDTDLIIFDNGGMCFEVDAAMNSEVRLCVFQLAAISAACSEVAANYAAEHGKEAK